MAYNAFALSLRPRHRQEDLCDLIQNVPVDELELRVPKLVNLMVVTVISAFLQTIETARLVAA